ncbi:GNAT family N-acetyltransferase [Pullulanibacillus sp. KACC 23026]|uniref:GNAT family N-acetyltransferase n=1 Tax=Pullulanibacillus sp. KACC 23026 TaxID=3028315 RepID=UPI0023B19D20|nr:GNAT family N-acetyltransferase [Pullulanibacillus sp. KACC 23026]WEG14548.1 GNAT family N-acetyltransferase [Pullulanibacillus sp. KACC 23026]
MTIRKASLSDLSEITRLCLPLGYPVSEKEISSRVDQILNDNDHAVFVFETNEGLETLSGWIHIFGKHLIELEYAEIGGLVVDIEKRRQRIGERLMRRCEEWAKEKGYEEIRLRSGGQRKEAHAFYEKIGYQNINWQQLFKRQL